MSRKAAGKEVSKDEKLVVLLDRVAANLLEERPEAGEAAWKNVLETLYEQHPLHAGQMERKRLLRHREKLERTLVSARKALTSVGNQ
ncbi:unnamed protein product [Amoebophrya sp. A25]|nr:unnamed protein product [Amoebophrya sp. A25]|eukprot:GSA25T00020891001.1